MKHILNFDNFLTESKIEDLTNVEWPQIKGKDVWGFLDEMKRAKDKLEDQVYKIAAEEMEHQIQALFQENGIEVERISMAFHHHSNIVFAIGQQFFNIVIKPTEKRKYYLYTFSNKEDRNGQYLTVYENLQDFFEDHRKELVKSNVNN